MASETVNKYQLTDNLYEDPPISGQKYALLSFISPELIKNCKIRAVKVRGVVNTIEELQNRKSELEAKDKVHKIFYQEVGKWGIFKKEDESVLNELAGRRKEYLINSKKTHKERVKQSIKSGMQGKEYNVEEMENLLNNIEKTGDDEVKIINKSTTPDEVSGPKEGETFELQDDTEVKSEETENTKENNPDRTYVDTLENDEPIKGQEFCLYSFMQPEGIMNTNIRSVKIRGVFSTLEDAKKRAEILRKNDKDYDIFIDDTGKWMEQDPDPLSVPEAVYKNKKENQIMESLHKKCYDQKVHGDEKETTPVEPTKDEQKEMNKQMKKIPRKYIQQQKLRSAYQKRQEEKKNATEKETMTPEQIKEQQEILAKEQERILEKEKTIKNLTEGAAKINDNLEKIKAAYKKST